MAFIDLGDKFIAMQEEHKQPTDDGRHFGLVVDDKEAARISAWNRDPVFRVISINRDLGDKGPHRPPDLVRGPRSEMLVVETIAKNSSGSILQRKMTMIKAICPRCCVLRERSGFGKLIRSQATEFHYQPTDVASQKIGGLGASGAIHCFWRMTTKPAREQLTSHSGLRGELRALGYEGGYDAVRRYARAWGKEHASETASAYVPLSFAPGRRPTSSIGATRSS